MATLLVVDDNSFIRMKCSKILTDNNYHVIEAATGTQAVERYKDEKPDGVLLDLLMPEMDGLEALKELMNIDPDAKVMVVSAIGKPDVVLEALKSGAKDYIVKPFDEARILTAVDKLLGIKNLHRTEGDLVPIRIEIPWETLYLEAADKFIDRFNQKVSPEDYFYERKVYPLAYRDQGAIVLFETEDGPKEYFIIDLKNTQCDKLGRISSSKTEYLEDIKAVQERINKDHKNYLEMREKGD